MSAVDSDLGCVWEFDPEGFPGVERLGGIYVLPPLAQRAYGPRPWRFQAYRQNGGRVHLRMVNPDGSGRYWDASPILRRAYASDLRRGVYWRRSS